MSTQTKKILYIVTQSEQGGAQQHIAQLAQNIDKRLFEVHLAAGGNGWLFRFFEKEKSWYLKNLVRPINPIKDIGAFLELYFLIKKLKPDVVHLHSSKAGIIGALAAKLGGVKKVIYTVHGFVFLEPMPTTQTKFYIWAEKISARLKDAIICVSDYDRRIGIEYKIAPKEKFITIYNGIDLERTRFLSKEKAREKIQILAGKESKAFDSLLIGTIANLYHTKGIEYLIRAAKIVNKNSPDALFVVIGEGRERKKLEVEIQKNQLKNFFLLGALENASQYLAAFDIYVCSSVKEGFPYTLLEAMAAGLPIVSTNIGGIPEMLSDGYGLMVEAKSEKNIAQAIQELINNPSRAILLGNNAAQRVAENFSMRQFLKKTLALYS